MALMSVATPQTPHCDHCLTAPVRADGARRGHCSVCGVLCWDWAEHFEMGLAFCSAFCEDVRMIAECDPTHAMDYARG